jgi:hypothetical protein
MSDFSIRFRRFVRKDAVLFATVPFMVLLNVLSNTITQGIFGFTFPWSLIPIGGIAIAVVDDAAKIFMAEAMPPRDARPSMGAATTATDAYLAHVRRYRQDVDQMAKTSRFIHRCSPANPRIRSLTMVIWLPKRRNRRARLTTT